MNVNKSTSLNADAAKQCPNNLFELPVYVFLTEKTWPKSEIVKHYFLIPVVWKAS